MACDKKPIFWEARNLFSDMSRDSIQHPLKRNLKTPMGTAFRTLRNNLLWAKERKDIQDSMGGGGCPANRDDDGFIPVISSHVALQFGKVRGCEFLEVRENPMGHGTWMRVILWNLS